MEDKEEKLKNIETEIEEKTEILNNLINEIMLTEEYIESLDDFYEVEKIIYKWIEFKKKKKKNKNIDDNATLEEKEIKELLYEETKNDGVINYDEFDF